MRRRRRREGDGTGFLVCLCVCVCITQHKGSFNHIGNHKRRCLNHPLANYYDSQRANKRTPPRVSSLTHGPNGNQHESPVELALVSPWDKLGLLLRRIVPAHMERRLLQMLGKPHVPSH